MNRKKQNLILYILPIFFAFIISCKLEKKEIITKKESVVNGIFTMQPFSDFKSNCSANQLKNWQFEIQDFYDKNFIPNDFSGSLLIAKEGKIVFEKYRGCSNFEEKKPITNQTPIHIASLSKVLTATAIMLLVDSKKIRLDQKVNTILTNFPYPEITVRTLLNHRSGLRNYSYFCDKKEIWDPKNVLTNQDILDIVKNKNIDLEYKTDTHFSYCNTNYVFLTLIIEKIMKISYSEAIQKLICKPLGMKNTFVFDINIQKKSVCQSYKGHKIKYAFTYLDGIYGDKNIYSTPKDLLLFDLATYNPNFLNKNLIDQIYKGYSYESKGTRNYGLGIRLLEWENGKKYFYHNGWWHGNTAAYIKLKDEKTTIICLSNKYTRCTYKIKLLSSLFGDYPFKIKGKDESLE